VTMNPKGVISFMLIVLSTQIIYSKGDLNHLGLGFDNQKESVTIPFKSYNNLIIIESIIDGKNKLNLILDTGIRSLVLFNKSYVPKMSDQIFDIKFTGAGANEPMSAKVSIKHNLRLGDGVVANQINAVVLKRSNNYLHKLKGIKIHGAFGYQLFARFQVKIDYKNQLLTLTEPVKMSEINGYESIPISIHDTKPFIKTQILSHENEWKKLNLILDIGANHKILLLQKSSISTSLKRGNHNQRIAEGLSGSIYGIKTVANKIRLGAITYGSTEVLIPTKNTYHHERIEVEKHGSIGGKLFNKTTIVIDYINGYLFIQKNENNSIASNQLVV
jgi:hypothetical protein